MDSSLTEGSESAFLRYQRSVNAVIAKNFQPFIDVIAPSSLPFRNTPVISSPTWVNINPFIMNR